MSLSIDFLGTGTSTGTPMIGCRCPVCNSTDPRDFRCRSCVSVSADDGTRVVVDTPPEFRLLMVKAGYDRISAVIITHCHMDHVAGFDDVRRFNTLAGGAPIPCFAAPETLDSLRGIFPYISDRPDTHGLFRPMIVFTPVNGPFRVGGIDITPLPVRHDPVRTNGYLFERAGARVAHIPDCHEIPESTLEILRERPVDILSLNCLRDSPHPTHLSLETAVAYARETGAKRTFFVHMSHSLPHAATERALPPDIRLAYDGLRVEIPRDGGAGSRAAAEGGA